MFMGSRSGYWWMGQFGLFRCICTWPFVWLVTGVNSILITAVIIMFDYDYHHY